MSMPMRRLLPFAPGLLLALGACTSPAPEGVTNPAAPGAVADDLPVLVGALSPAPTSTQRLSPSPQAGLASPRPSASVAAPSPAPTPQLVEGESYFVRLPVPAWKLVTNNQKPPVLTLEASYAPGKLNLSSEAQNTNLTLERKQAEVRTSLGAGVVAQQSITLDGVRGFLITANMEQPEGKRFLAYRGFYYRNQFWKLEATWDKRHLEASRVEKDVDAILKTFGWL